MAKAARGLRFREVALDCLKGRRSFGQMRNLFRYASGRMKEAVDWQPVCISAYPTRRCNFSCDMCLTHSSKKANPFGQKPGRDMDFELFAQVLSRYENALAVNLFGNGEPLLNQDLFRMIEYASRVRNMHTFSGSNGVVVGEYAERIVCSSLTEFFISINGHNPEEFHRMTGMPAGLFEVIRANILDLVKRRNERKSDVWIVINIILDRSNYRCLEDMIRFAEGLGVDKVQFVPFLASPAPGFAAEERSLYSEDSVRQVFARAGSLRWKVEVALPILLERAAAGKYCLAPFYNLSVDGEGNVGCCSCQLLDFSGNGKLQEGDAWNNGHFREMRRRFLSPEAPLLEPCGWCFNNTRQARTASKPDPLGCLERLVRRGRPA